MGQKLGLPRLCPAKVEKAASNQETNADEEEKPKAPLDTTPTIVEDTAVEALIVDNDDGGSDANDAPKTSDTPRSMSPRPVRSTAGVGYDSRRASFKPPIGLDAGRQKRGSLLAPIASDAFQPANGSPRNSVVLEASSMGGIAPPPRAKSPS